MMAHRSDREPGYPVECPRHHSLQSRVGPSSRIPSGPAVYADRINRPDRRLHPTQRQNLKSPLATREPSTEDTQGCEFATQNRSFIQVRILLRERRAWVGCGDSAGSSTTTPSKWALHKRAWSGKPNKTFVIAAYPPTLSEASSPTASAPKGPAIVPNPGGPKRRSSC